MTEDKEINRENEEKSDEEIVVQDTVDTENNNDEEEDISLDNFWDDDFMELFTDENLNSPNEVDDELKEEMTRVFSKLEVKESSEKELGESESLFNTVRGSYNMVDEKLFDFIGNFVVNQDNAAKQKKSLKNVFFWFAMISFAVIILTPIICLIILMHQKVTDFYLIYGAIVASTIEVLTTIVVLPKIVAEYLFNKEEENANIKIVELMQQYSETMHGYEKE